MKPPPTEPICRRLSEVAPDCWLTQLRANTTFQDRGLILDDIVSNF